MNFYFFFYFLFFFRTKEKFIYNESFPDIYEFINDVYEFKENLN